MLLQADRGDFGPAFTWLLFDAQDAKQSARKDRAFNFVPNQGFGASALEVVLGGFPFTALGHRTDTRWVVDNGIPAVEAVWWAGGVRVTERISALVTASSAARSLQSAHLAGEEAASRCACVCRPAACASRKTCSCTRATARAWPWRWRMPPVARGRYQRPFDLGPVTIAPGKSATVETLLLVQVPLGERTQWVARATQFITVRDRPRRHGRPPVPGPQSRPSPRPTAPCRSCSTKRAWASSA